MGATANTRVALVGCGRWGRLILRDLQALGCHVTAVDPDPAARALANAGAAVWDEVRPDAVAGTERFAGIVVATPTSTHAKVVADVLRAGVPVFCEKPLAASPDEALAMQSERLFAMHVWRYHPGIEALAAIARREELGPVLGLRTTRLGWTSPRTDVDATQTLVPHDLSIALAVLGHIPTPRHALAERLEGRAVGMLATLQDADGPWFVLEASTRYADKRREVRLHCRDGVAWLPHGESTALQIVRGAGERPEIELRDFDPEPALMRELRAFVAHLRGGPPPPTSAAEGLAVVRALAELRTLAGLERSGREAEADP